MAKKKDFLRGPLIDKYFWNTYLPWILMGFLMGSPFWVIPLIDSWVKS